MDPTLAVLMEIADERDSQDAKWGEQNHPDDTGHHVFPLWAVPSYANRFDAAHLADIFKDACQNDNWADNWADILLEEVFEALAENGPELREELIQVAAVAVAWVEAIDRRED